MPAANTQARDREAGQIRIAVHDYPGHPFQADLSRELARRGYAVTHLFSAGVVSPRGRLRRSGGDPEHLRFVAVGDPDHGPARDRLVARWLGEYRYGRALVRALAETAPDVVLSGNTPIDAQVAALAWCRRNGVRFVHWLQDVIGDAMTRILGSRLGPLGTLIGKTYTARERAIWRGSNHVISISGEFDRKVAAVGIPAARRSVIANWAPVHDLPVTPKDNPWSRARGLDRRFVFLYAGTLGFKHNPELLLELAETFRGVNDTAVVVVSEGPAADWIAREARVRGLDNVLTVGFQPQEVFREVLGAGDVLVALLEPEASGASVPSKVLSYMCASRPILAAVPASNPAARLVSAIGAGIVADPRSPRRFVDAALQLRRVGPAVLSEMGGAAREYAEAHFDIRVIADRFERVLRSVLEGGAEG